MIKGVQWMKIKELKNQGMKIKHIAEKIGVARGTVYNNKDKEIRPKYKRTINKPSKLEPYQGYIKNRLEEYNLTAEKIYQEIQQLGYQGKYSLLANYVSKLKRELKNQAVIRFETLPGEQAQVDWGSFGSMYDKDLKKEIKISCFFMILGYSRTLYIEFFDKADLEKFLIGHNHAFEYFGGYTREILYDNLKSVVIKRAMRAEDSDFNKKFIDFAGYYGFAPTLCRPYKPNTKGKVENSVNYVKQNFFAGRTFNSLKELNKQAKIWLDQANQRIHATTKEKPFDRLKRETLISIENKKMYDTNIIQYRKVFNDCHFSYEANKYSVPYAYAGKEVAVKKEKHMLYVSYQNKEIANHNLEIQDKGKYITQSLHLEGLLDVRLSHGIKRPKKKEKATVKKTIEILNYNQTIPSVKQRDLNVYEKVGMLCKN